jgi:hypothetical protein
MLGTVFEGSLCGCDAWNMCCVVSRCVRYNLVYAALQGAHAANQDPVECRSWVLLADHYDAMPSPRPYSCTAPTDLGFRQELHTTAGYTMSHLQATCLPQGGSFS